ncbi:MAG TPA: TolC family protein [Anaeromyxobacter sp.]|nr:TolC family protein [Anaeromyxobacter sp.]
MSPLPAALLIALAASAPGAAPLPPLTLDDALALSARSSAELAGARADQDASAADRTNAWSGVLPRLDLSASFAKNHAGPSQPKYVFFGGQAFPVAGGPATTTSDYNAGLQLVQPVFDWRAFREIDRAGAAARAVDRQYGEAVLTVAFTVTQRFYELLKAERTLAVLEATTRRSEELVDRADALFAAGRAPKSETWSARANLSQDRINAEAQRIQVAAARTALAQAMGTRDAGEGLEVVAPATLDAPGIPDAEPPPLADLLERAREKRPTLGAQRALVEASQAAVGSAQAGWFPTLSAQGTYTRNAQNLTGAGGVYDDPTRDYTATAQLVLSWNLFAGRSTQAGVQRAEASLSRARADRDRTELQVEKELADARTRVVTLGRQIGLATDALRVAREALALAGERLQAGLASQLEVRDASLKLTQAELAVAQTRIDHAVAVADLARAAGGAF